MLPSKKSSLEGNSVDYKRTISFWCIDLIFTSQPNLIIESDNPSSYKQNCSNQTVHTKVNSKIIYSPPYLW